MDNRRLDNGEIVLGLKSQCAFNEKVVKKDENLGNLAGGVSNGSSLGTRETVLGMKSKCDHDEKVVKNDENLRNLPEGVSISNALSLENGTKELTKTPGQCKSWRSRGKANMVTSSPRVLRSRSQEKPKAPEPVDAPLQDAQSKEKSRKKKKKVQKDHNDEFSKIKGHLRYVLGRMKYEQNFIDAYAGEGWKGQSLEKIRPEKELERAKSDIRRYKLKIRDLFKRIDTSCEEGRIPESLYDSEGEIDSEDIFCSKCGKTEVQLDNDIILCDGACERGFHQYCLDPPLLKEQVPPGDEGWLCPACDCKVDCVDLLNDSMETDLSIEDSWEKVFPETAASGNKLDDNLGLPSDDSEDDDYNPDGPQVEEDDCNPDGPHVEEGDIDAEDSSSDESDFSSASEDLGDFAKNEQFLGLPSEDSEDDDFNPDRLDSDEEAKKESSSSDFTSGSDDLSDIKNEVTSDEVRGTVMSQDKEKLTEANMENDDFGPITAKRNVKRLNYEKLHDEAYGNVSSDSSDEDFFDSEAPSKRKNTEGAKDMKSNKKLKRSESTPVSKKLDVEGTSSSPAHKDTSNKNGNRSSSNGRFGEAATQRLNEVFKENHYPNRGVRENLVKELNLTHSQVSKWFDNARSKLVKSPLKPAEKLVTEQTHQEADFFDSEAPSRRKNTEGAKDAKSNRKQKQSESTPVRKKLDVEDISSSPAHKDSNDKKANRSSPYKRLGEAAIQRLNEAFEENHYPDRGVKENLVKELNLTHSQVIKWFEHARWRFNHPEGRSKLVKSPLKPAEKLVTKQTHEVISTAPKSRKRKTRADQASQVESSDQTPRRSGRVQAKRL